MLRYAVTLAPVLAAAALAPNSPRDAQKTGVQVAGAIIAPVALLLMLYSLALYRARTFRILRREVTRYDDPWGPPVLTALLVATMLVAYGITLKAALSGSAVSGGVAAAWAV